ncbi:Transposable element P transposase [Frankliniella fusca]|uniref:Transposable element P transposase n=1 Tax=Frankliniella fusca TaxID=407009 RepID=A0AAE1HZW5_9NEOP|nr:Transposable element P transposase [Frankliniella fusca]
MTFVRIPKNREQAAKWKSVLPPDFRFRTRTYFCEIHFDENHFEGRAVGKRLKANAVLKPLGDSTNRRVASEALVAAEGLILLHQSMAAVPEKPQAPVDAIDCLTQYEISVPTAVCENLALNSSLCAKPDFEGGSSDQMPRTADRPMFTSTPVIAASTFDAIEESCGASQTPARKKTMASTKFMFSSTPGRECDENDDFHSANELLCSATTPTSLSSNESTVMLDEKTGTWIQVEGEPCDSSPVIESKEEPDQFQEMLEIMAQQRIQLETAQHIIADQCKQLEALEEEIKQSTYKKKWQAAVKAKNRIRHKLRRKLKSPWLTERQMMAVLRNSNRGMQWKTPEIRDGLILKMKCGSKGYAAWVKQYPILPSLRSLQEAVQFIKIHGKGLEEDMFDILESIVPALADKERDCAVVLDEMDIQQGRVWDPSTGLVLGECTLPGHEGLAKKALVFILAGVSRRWKVAVAVFFTRQKGLNAKKEENKTGEEYQKILDDIVLRAEKIGLKPCAILSDMGPDNLALWKAYGIDGTRGYVHSTVESPTRAGEKIAVMPDPIHLLKNIKNQLENSKVFILPEDVVKEHNLPTNKVTYEHIENLYHYEKGKELKIAFRLKEWNVYCKSHFSKMNMGSTRGVMCHSTVTGLKHMGAVHADKSYYTTAWFVENINIFFELVTCRSRGLAISKHNCDAFDRVIGLFDLVERTFSGMCVGDKGEWKPCQRGMRVLIESYFHLIPYFLETRGYSFLMLGRLTDDCIENIFSLIRFRQPVPHAQSVLHCLKVIVLAQFAECIKGSSYDYDQTEKLSDDYDFLEEARKRYHERAESDLFKSEEELAANPVRQLCTTDFSTIDDEEKRLLYDMAGSTVTGVISSGQKLCDTCIKSARWTDSTPHPCSSVTDMKEFTFFKGVNDGPKLFYVSEDVFRSILSAEITFRMLRERTLKMKYCHVLKYFVDSLMYVWNDSSLHDCHGLRRKILTYFIEGRLKEFTKRSREEVKHSNVKASVESMGSKSVYMRAVVNKMKSVKRDKTEVRHPNVPNPIDGKTGSKTVTTAVKKTGLKDFQKRAAKEVSVSNGLLEPSINLAAMKAALEEKVTTAVKEIDVEEEKDSNAPPKPVLNVNAIKALLLKKLG